MPTANAHKCFGQLKELYRYIFGGVVSPLQPPSDISTQRAALEVDYLELCVPFHFVDTKSALARMKLTLDAMVFHQSEGDVCLLGIDMEWHFRRRKAAILQIATKNEVFIVDLIEVFTSAELEDAIHEAFQSTSVVKLGYGVRNDLLVLHDTFPDVRHIKRTIAGKLCRNLR